MFKLSTLLLASLLQTSVAFAADPAPQWKWSTDTPERSYYIESLETWSVTQPYIGEKSAQDIRITQFELKATTRCKTVEITRKIVRSRCSLDEIAVILLALRDKERDDATLVADYYQRLLKGSSVDIEQTHEGKIIFVDLVGPTKNNYRNRSTFNILRQRIVTAFSCFDLQLSPKYHEGDVWIQKSTRLSEFEQMIGNLPVAHTLVKHTDTQAIFHTAGSGVIGEQFDVHVEGDTLFDVEAGQLQSRSWSVLGIPRQSFSSSIPHTHTGFMKVLEGEATADVGATGEWYSTATQDTAVVLMAVILEKHQKANEKNGVK